jgi:hypothetical protein
MAIFYHSISTSANPIHHMCPTGPTSWCKHNRAVAKDEPPPPHNQTIPYEISHLVKRVFLNLSKPSLMDRCVLGATQNQCESFNSVIWNRCPKTDFYSSTVVEIAAYMAVLTFNSGHGALKDVLELLRIPYGPTVEAYLKSTDDTRIWQAQYKGRELVKKRRRQMRLDRVTTEQEQLEAEGVQYEAGGF